MMPTQLPRFARAAAIFTFGMLAGVAVAIVVVVPLQMRQQYERGMNGAANEGALFLRLLSSIDQNDASVSKRNLDQLVDGNLLILANYASGNAETGTNRFVFRTLESIREYRRVHPSSANDAAFRERIEKALSAR
jgi:hypothetical protein